MDVSEPGEDAVSVGLAGARILGPAAYGFSARYVTRRHLIDARWQRSDESWYETENVRGGTSTTFFSGMGDCV